MVRGLELFREHFKGYEDQYVLIGGVACDLAMSAVGESFRVTKDLDIVLCMESLGIGFGEIFWDFVKNGRYENRQRSTGRRLFYRFHSPQDKNYPYMLELFSRTPDSLNIAEGHLTPIPMGDDVSSLSAILLDEEYYSFIHQGKTDIEGIPVVRAEFIVPLKARAWLDLKNRQAEGEPVDDKIIRKHRNDVFRLARILVPGDTPALKGQVAADMSSFIMAMISEPVQLQHFGYQSGQSKEELLEGLKEVYKLNR